MRRNRLKALWREDKTALLTFLSIPSAYATEVMAQQGFDALSVDLQHGMLGIESAIGMFQAISTTEVVPLVRVPLLEPALIMKVLDAGAYGVICPFINSAADAQALVRWCRYPPKGERSFGPARALLYGGPDYPDRAADEVVTIGMIETRRALDELDAICATPGLDAIYVGPADLALDLGLRPDFTSRDPELLAALHRIVSVARKHGVVAGTHTGDPAYAAEMIERGFRLVGLLNDAKFMALAAGERVRKLRGSGA